MPLERSASPPAAAQAAHAGSDELHHSTAAPILPPERSLITRTESTELERRVVAQERILQAIVARMVKTEPKFLLRRTNTFCVPLEMTHSEQDYTDTASYAADFVRSVASFGENAARNPSASAKKGGARKVALPAADSDEAPFMESPRVQILM